MIRSRAWLQDESASAKQAGYFTVTMSLPLGDITANQLRSLADIVAPLHQRNDSHDGRAEFRDPLGSAERSAGAVSGTGRGRLGAPGAGALVDIVSCPGTDTCKLGISSSRGLAGELRKRVSQASYQSDEAVRNLHIKVSGCFNSCGQHHVADMGFYGVSRKMAGYAVPHFQVVLGGEWKNNGGSYGLPVVAVPSKNIPDVVQRLTDRYVSGREPGETFKQYIKRTGKAELKKMLDDLDEACRPGRSLIFQRLGRSARVHAGRYGRRRVRRRSRVASGLWSGRSRTRAFRRSARSGEERRSTRWHVGVQGNAECRTGSGAGGES